MVRARTGPCSISTQQLTGDKLHDSEQDALAETCHLLDTSIGRVMLEVILRQQRILHCNTPEERLRDRGICHRIGGLTEQQVPHTKSAVFFIKSITSDCAACGLHPLAKLSISQIHVLSIQNQSILLYISSPGVVNWDTLMTNNVIGTVQYLFHGHTSWHTQFLNTYFLWRSSIRPWTTSKDKTWRCNKEGHTTQTRDTVPPDRVWDISGIHIYQYFPRQKHNFCIVHWQ